MLPFPNPRCRMAKKIAIAILVVFLILFAYLQSRYISSSYKELTEAAGNIGVTIQNQDIEKTNESIDAFGVIWENNSETWMSLILHEHVDSVYQNYLLMKEYARLGDLKLASVYLRQLEYALKDVESLDHMSIKNIF